VASARGSAGALIEYDKNYSELANAPLFWIADYAEATRSYMTLLASF
jgi:hypothetical protein